MARSLTARRLGGAVVLASLTATFLAASPAAAATTRWVDDDGKAGSSSCDGTKTAKKHIQDAVDAAGPDDTIKVCPGSYVENVVVKGDRDGLTLKSTTSHKAIVKADDVFNATTTILMKIKDVDDVTVNGFSIRPLRDDTSGYCSWSTGISATNAKSLDIKNNEISPAGQGAFCGVSDGIAASGGSTGSITDNTVTDYRETGIHLLGASTNVAVTGNTVTFAHAGLSPAGGAAVGVDTGAKGAIDANIINGPAAGPGNPPQPAAGIDLDHAASGSTVTDNTIARMAADIRIYVSSGGTISGNTMTGGQVGLDLLDGDSFSIHDNDSSAATVHGLAVGAASTGNDVHDNDFRTNSNGNILKDCQGDSGTGMSNTWANDLGHSSSPAVLCNGRSTVPG